jgi:hypothetical protein
LLARCGRTAGVEQDTHGFDPRFHLPQKAKTLGLDHRIQITDACNISAGPAETCNKSARNGISDEHRNDRRRSSRRGSHFSSHVAADRYEHLRLSAQEISRLSGQPLVTAVRPTIVDRSVLPLDYSLFGHAFAKCIDKMFAFLGGSRAEKTDDRLARALRARRARPYRDGNGNPFGEIASPHCLPRLLGREWY